MCIYVYRSEIETERKKEKEREIIIREKCVYIYIYIFQIYRVYYIDRTVSKVTHQHRHFVIVGYTLMPLSLKVDADGYRLMLQPVKRYIV